MTHRCIECGRRARWLVSPGLVDPREAMITVTPQPGHLAVPVCRRHQQQYLDRICDVAGAAASVSLRPRWVQALIGA